VAVFLAFTVPAFSQLPTPALLNVTRVQVRNDRIPEFLELARQRAEAIRKAAPADMFNVAYRTVIGNTNEFWIISPLNKFADRDSENPFNKITTPEQRATWGARLSQYVERSLTTIDRPINDLNVIASGAKAPSPFVRYFRIRVRPGMEDQFINTVKNDIMPVIKKINGSMRVRQTALGGNTNDFTVAAAFEKWAELDDTTTFQKAIGGEQAMRKLEEKMSQIEAGTEQYILRYLPDLSYYPASAAASR